MIRIYLFSFLHCILISHICVYMYAYLILLLH